MATQFIRVSKKSNYTVLDNTFIKDRTLSAKAKGIMTYLLSLPDDWNISMAEIKENFSDGKASIESGVRELIDRGYITREQCKDDKGHFTSCDYAVYEKPFDENPPAENPYTENPSTENRTLQSTNIQSTNIQSTKKESAREKPLKNVVPPTREMVANYIAEKNMTIDPDRFIDYYESNGWKVGRTKMKDWQSTLRGWQSRAIAKTSGAKTWDFMDL